ncbi:helix-turn-helix domain containing protein [Streptomyces sp. SP17BM10]|uniref:helix-turn-helix domain-containing protein n=1 Tax=Streptomyces sp. SP17BM10 TaxID=3002530 RepID=UPI002E782866|nr:helix-turn-helix domain-containing protein [Streptomyces sp. SP17BM10]MEE1784174.1 helix-turn-helix domain containing protein [Streptomyces sp. SP17BM10]
MIDYDPNTGPHTPAHQVRTPARQEMSKPALRVFRLIFVVSAGVGLGGAVATFFNMKAAFGSGWTAIGIVAGGEGAIAVLGLTLVGLTLISRPYPAGLRVGLWLVPIAAAVTGAAVAAVKDDYQHAVVNVVTPVAMTVAAEMAGFLARSIVVASTGVDAEADRKTGEILRQIEWHQARAQHHPDERARKRSGKAAWKLARNLGQNDPRLGQSLPAAYAERTANTALTALDALYHRVPAQQPAELPAPAPVAPAAVEPPTTPTVEQVPAVEEEMEAWQPDPGIYAEAEVEEDQAVVVEPLQPQLPVDRWLKSVSDQVRIEVHTDVHTGSDQQIDAEDGQDEADEDQEPETTGEMTPERRRELILEAIAEGASQREAARRADCSPSYVRKVVNGEAAA